MASTEKRAFVYGDFNPPPAKSSVRTRNPLGGIRKLTPPIPPPGYSPYAIEILREFSGSEFIGKVYQLSASLHWDILGPQDAEQSYWYKTALKRPREVKFEMQGSGQWTVQNVRIESDELGQYVAVALSNS